MYTDPNDSRFAFLGTPRRIWAVAAVNAQAQHLMAVHDHLYRQIEPGDRIVYLGNYIGLGPAPAETIDELLTFRRGILTIPGVLPEDIIYLRGGQEDLWRRLLQVHFTPNPPAILGDILNQGLAVTLTSYGIDINEGLHAACEGILPLTRWTARIRDSLRRRPGHEAFTNLWRRAAYTLQDVRCPLLFVHAGINPARPLYDQGDSFWRDDGPFRTMTAAYDPFHKVVRGYDPTRGGLYLNGITATLDAGCGFGGELVCAGFDHGGEIFDLVAA